LPQQTSHVSRTQHLVKTPVACEPTGSATYATNINDDYDTAATLIKLVHFVTYNRWKYGEKCTENLNTTYKFKQLLQFTF